MRKQILLLTTALLFSQASFAANPWYLYVSVDGDDAYNQKQCQMLAELATNAFKVLRKEGKIDQDISYVCKEVIIID